MPSDKAIEASLRKAIRARYGKVELTVNNIREVTRKELKLDDEFFEDDSRWKAQSKIIIKDEIAHYEALDSDNEEKEVAPVEPVEKKMSLKRSSPAQASRPRKKSKLAQDDDDEESTALSDPPVSDEDVKPAKKKAKAKPAHPLKPKKSTPKPKEDTSSELSDAPPEQPEEELKADDTSSELSSLIDEPAPPRKKAKTKNGESKPKKTAKSKVATEADPNAEEIKKLQGWLAKCGIRKVWGKELKPYETPKAKISHLKSLLSDVGMTGRYSNEKAAQIKEARELAADIEAVQEGNERWGKTSGDEEEEEEEAEDQGRPKRRLIRGAQHYDFLSSDGEETD